MKISILSIVFIIILAVFIILGIKGNTMREIRTEIDIAVPATRVWSIITDIDNWEDWNPIINQASGVASLDSELSITMRGEDGSDGPKYMPIVTIFDEPTLFRWRGKMMSEFLFTNDKVLELVDTGSGTRLIHKELFKGMLVPLFWSKLTQGVPSMLESMNVALKDKAEESTSH